MSRSPGDRQPLSTWCRRCGTGRVVQPVLIRAAIASMHAALIDYGDTGVLSALLHAGADKTAKSAEGLTAAAFAKQSGHASFAPLLE